jgi:hypothetical protein
VTQRHVGILGQALEVGECPATKRRRVAQDDTPVAWV